MSCARTTNVIKPAIATHKPHFSLECMAHLSDLDEFIDLNFKDGNIGFYTCPAKVLALFPSAIGKSPACASCRSKFLYVSLTQTVGDAGSDDLGGRLLLQTSLTDD